MSYVAIAAQIVVLLKEISDFNNVVYDHEAKELKKYPCATVTSLEHYDEFADTARNKRRFVHVIRCYYPSADPALAEQVLRGIVDSVISKIEGNISLNATCDYAMPSSGKWGYVEREIPLRYVEITIEAQKRLLR